MKAFMSLATIRNLLTNIVSIKSPVLRTNQTNSSFPSLASGVGGGSGVGRREDAVDSYDVVVGIEDLSKVVPSITVKTESVGSIVTPAEVRNWLTGSIRVKVPVG